MDIESRFPNFKMQVLLFELQKACMVIKAIILRNDL